MTGALSAAAFSEMVGAIYDCAIEPAGWPSVLDRLRRELNFCNALLALHALPSGRAMLAVSSGIEEPWLSAMERYAGDIIDQWGGVERIQGRPLGEPIVLTDVNPNATSPDNRYYVEWAVPQGIIDVMVVGVARDGASIGTLSLGRHNDAGVITAREVETARLLSPHLRRAVTISRLLDMQTVSAGTFAAVIDSLSVAVLLTDAALTIVHANAAARAMLAEGDVLKARSGKLKTHASIVDGALAAAVGQAVRDETDSAERSIDIPLCGVEGRRHVLHVLPVRPGTLRAGAMPSAMAAIFVAPADRPSAAGFAAMAAVFGLTAMEARILEDVARGLTSAEIAEQLGVRLSTVKTHVHHLFEKTGARRQAELVSLAASFDIPVRR